MWKIATCLLVASFLLCPCDATSKYISLSRKHRYNESVPIFVRDLSSLVRPQIRHSVLNIPGCVVREDDYRAETYVDYYIHLVQKSVGRVLISSKTHRIPYNARFLVDEECVHICPEPIQLDDSMLAFTMRMIQYQYNAQYIIDLFPAASHVYNHTSVQEGEDVEWERHPRFSTPIGKFAIADFAVLYNHVHFDIQYTEDNRISSVISTPRSQVSCDQRDKPQRLFRNAVVTPSMSFAWHKIGKDEDVHTSFEHYVGGATDGKIDVPLMYMLPPFLVLLFSVFITYNRVYLPIHILRKGMRESSSRTYSNSALAFLSKIGARIDVLEIFGLEKTFDSSWRTIKEHVFKRPHLSSVLASFAAIGIQNLVLFITIASVMIMWTYSGYFMSNMFTGTIIYMCIMSPGIIGLCNGILLQCMEVHDNRMHTMKMLLTQSKSMLQTSRRRQQRRRSTKSPYAHVDKASDTRTKDDDKEEEENNADDGQAETELLMAKQNAETKGPAKRTESKTSDFIQARFNRLHRHANHENDRPGEVEAGGGRPDQNNSDYYEDSANEQNNSEERAAPRPHGRSRTGEADEKPAEAFKMAALRVCTKSSAISLIVTYLFYVFGYPAVVYINLFLRMSGVNTESGDITDDNIIENDLAAIDSDIYVYVMLWIFCTAIIIFVALVFGRMYQPRSGYQQCSYANMETLSYSHTLFVLKRMIFMFIVSALCLGPPMYGMYSVIWDSRVDYAFLYAIANVTMTMAAISIITAVFVFQLLLLKEHKWHWTSFHLGGSIAWFVIFFAISFYTYSDMSGFVPTILYTLWTLVIFFFIYFMFGSISFVTSYAFVSNIYNKISPD